MVTRAIMNYDHQNQIRDVLEEANFKSEVRSKAKDIYEDLSASRTEEAEHKLGEELEGWLEYLLDIVYDVDVEYDKEEGIVYMVVLERINPEADEDWGWREDTRFQGIDVSSIIDELKMYRRGSYPETRRREVIIPDSYMKNPNKRNFKNLTRNIIADEIRSFMDEVVYDVSTENELRKR